MKRTRGVANSIQGEVMGNRGEVMPNVVASSQSPASSRQSLHGPIQKSALGSRGLSDGGARRQTHRTSSIGKRRDAGSDAACIVAVQLAEPPGSAETDDAESTSIVIVEVEASKMRNRTLLFPLYTARFGSRLIDYRLSSMEGPYNFPVQRLEALQGTSTASVR